MNPEVKEKWLTALRSGEYPQTKGALHNTEGYCCLGVLCDIAAKEGIVNELPPGEYHLYGTFNGASSYLPVEVRVWAGLWDEQGNPSTDVYLGLPTVNDNGGTFEEIADLIQERY